jgi:hypothetical protein
MERMTMAIDKTPPPPPPVNVEQHAKPSSARIADKRKAFARKTPQTEQDRVAARAFIDGKIEMIRRDPNLTEAQKAEAIADLEARRDAEEKELRRKPPK